MCVRVCCVCWFGQQPSVGRLNVCVWVCVRACFENSPSLTVLDEGVRRVLSHYCREKNAGNHASNQKTLTLALEFPFQKYFLMERSDVHTI